MTRTLDLLGLAFVATGTGVQVHGWIVVWTLGPVGFGHVAIGGGTLVAGLLMLGGSWMRDRQATPGGSHRSTR